jgi:hypothetical protein
VAATALLAKSLPQSAVTRPEPDNYGKKRRFGQCGKRDGVASWVRAGNDRCQCHPFCCLAHSMRHSAQYRARKCL